MNNHQKTPSNRQQPLNSRVAQRMGIETGPRPADNCGVGAVPPTVPELSDLVIQLKDIMQQETAMLERHDYDDLPRTTEQKRIIAGLLRDKQKVLKQHPDALHDAPEADREKLKCLLGEMQEIGKRNEIVVRTARDANKMLLDAVIRGATKQSQLGSGYGSTGAMTALTANYGARQAVSLFSNEVC